MKKTDFDLEDNEIRIVGENPGPYGNSRKWVYVLIAVVAAALAGIVVFNKVYSSGTPEEQSLPVSEVLPGNEGCIIRDTVISDIALKLFIPSGTPSLYVGRLLPEYDTNIVFAAEAAYYRKDNNQISGAFILEGEQLARGCSMLGYCAIIHGEIYLGQAKSTSLFEEAVEEEGYFFRQKPLVDSCRAVHEQNNRRNPSIKVPRNAIVKLDNRSVVVGCETPVTRNDFADVLVRLGCRQAVSLSGRDNFGFARDTADNIHYWGQIPEKNVPENINYIIWKK